MQSVETQKWIRSEKAVAEHTSPSVAKGPKGHQIALRNGEKNEIEKQIMN